MAEWIKFKHPNAEKWQDRDKFVWDLYSGKAQDKAKATAKHIAEQEAGAFADNEPDPFPNKVEERKLGKYLIRKIRGEPAENFYERSKVSKFPAHFSQIVDKQVGSVQLAGYEQNRWEKDGDAPLGTPEDEESIAKQLMENADGKGTNWDTLMAQGIKHLYLKKRVWYLAEGPTEKNNNFRVIFLDSVTNWKTEDGRLTDVVVVEKRDSRNSIRDKHGTEQIFIHYNTEGFRRYDKDGNPLGPRSEWDNPFYESPARQNKTVPIGFVELGLPRDVPKQMAEGQKFLYNELSDVRNAMRISSFPKISYTGDKQAWEDTIRALRQGANIIRAENASWMGLPWSDVSKGRDIYKEDVKEYYTTSFSQLEDAAREATATEIMLKDQRGRQSFLVHLADRANELENSIRFKLAQIARPGSPEQWRIPYVERSTDFAPTSPNSKSKKIKEIFFPKSGVNMGGLKRQAAEKVADLQGFEFEEEEENSDQSAMLQDNEQIIGDVDDENGSNEEEEMDEENNSTE